MEMALVVRVYTGRLSRTRTISIDTMLVIELPCPTMVIRTTMEVNSTSQPFSAHGSTDNM
jgi:hypothetical protein